MLFMRNDYVCIFIKVIVEDICIVDLMIWSSGFNMFEYKE